MLKYFIVIMALFIIMIITLSIKISPKSTNLEILPQKTDEELLSSIKIINQNLDKINYLSYKNVKIKLFKGIYFRAKADLSFKKDKNIRIIINNLFGKQLDVGSNDEIFWFWSKYMNPPKYYYSKHEDLKKIGLKTPLQPEWLIESMGFKKIDFENITFVKKDNFKGIRQSRLGSLEELIYVLTTIDTKENIVVGRYMYDENNSVIASVEYKNYVIVNNTKVPNKLYVSWFQENIFMEWQIEDIYLNKNIDESIWEMPNINNISILEN